jgi:uncharacterized membrane protein YgdD (TMEM256/DUF423 family)
MRLWLIGGALNGILGVLGGFVAGHAALPVMVAGADIVRMGEHYQFWHAAVLLALAALPQRIMVGRMRRGGLCLLVGATAFGVSVQLAAIGGWPGLLVIAWAALATLAAGWLLLLIGAIGLDE